MNEIENILRKFIFSADENSRLEARSSIVSLAKKTNVYPASTKIFYNAIAKNQVNKRLTVPAINIRTLTFHTASMVFELMKKLNIGPVIFEIARSELSYTDQRPIEYALCILAAAINAKYKGPVFLQADHIQIRKDSFNINRFSEIENIKNLILEYIEAGFYNIDVDSSTLVNLDLASIDEQQKDNAEITAELTSFIATSNPSNVQITIGGEIGHIGDKNSTTDDLHSFMKQYRRLITDSGISKLSIQTGSTHGGTPDANGKVTPVGIDTVLLKTLGEIAKSDYQLAGVVQHGASTLSTRMFSDICDAGTLEIHLATGLQNVFFDTMPEKLKTKMYSWLNENIGNERKPEWSDQQFYYNTRKKALGPFKEKIWGMSSDDIKIVTARQESLLSEIFKDLGLNNTRDILEKLYEIH